jgi:hypothetical protein
LQLVFLSILIYILWQLVFALERIKSL